MVFISHRAMKKAKLGALYETYQETFGGAYSTNFVPGSGDVVSSLAFVGEAPGADEDRLQLPFVGASGRLLDRALGHIALERDQVYITNLMKYRPPNNRDPLPDEVTPMMTMLRMELHILDPRLVVPLGRFAASMFWPRPVMADIAGKVWVKGEFMVVPVHHPSWVLRDKKQNMPVFAREMEVVGETLEQLLKPKKSLYGKRLQHR